MNGRVVMAGSRHIEASFSHRIASASDAASPACPRRSPSLTAGRTYVICSPSMPSFKSAPHTVQYRRKRVCRAMQRRCNRHVLHMFTYACVAIWLLAMGCVFSAFALFVKESEIAKVWLAGPTTMAVGMVLCGKVLIDLSHRRQTIDSRSHSDDEDDDVGTALSAAPMIIANNLASSGYQPPDPTPVKSDDDEHRALVNSIDAQYLQAKQHTAKLLDNISKYEMSEREYEQQRAVVVSDRQEQQHMMQCSAPSSTQAHTNCITRPEHQRALNQASTGHVALASAEDSLITVSRRNTCSSIHSDIWSRLSQQPQSECAGCLLEAVAETSSSGMDTTCSTPTLTITTPAHSISTNTFAELTSHPSQTAAPVGHRHTLAVSSDHVTHTRTPTRTANLYRGETFVIKDKQYLI